MQLRNTNPLGAVDLPLIGRQGEPIGEECVGCLEPGEVFEIDDEQGNALLKQAGNYELVSEPKEPTARGRRRQAAAADTDPTDDEPSGAVEDDTVKGEAQ